MSLTYKELDMFGDRSFESRDILDTDEFLDWLSVLEYDNRRDTHYTELARSPRFSIDIMFHDLRCSCDFGSELFETRKHNLAWPTPLSPEVDESNASGDMSYELSISRNEDRRHRDIDEE